MYYIYICTLDMPFVFGACCYHMLWWRGALRVWSHGRRSVAIAVSITWVMRLALCSTMAKSSQIKATSIGWGVVHPPWFLFEGNSRRMYPSAVHVRLGWMSVLISEHRALSDLVFADQVSKYLVSTLSRYYLSVRWTQINTSEHVAIKYATMQTTSSYGHWICYACCTIPMSSFGQRHADVRSIRVLLCIKCLICDVSCY